MPMKRPKRSLASNVSALASAPCQCTQRLVHNLLDRPQRMIQWHPRFAAQIAEQRLAPDISTAHRTFPHISSRSAHYTPYLAPKCHFFRILLEGGQLALGDLFPGFEQDLARRGG